MTMTITYLQDPGHGWFVVPKSEALSLGLGSADFTSFSMLDKDNYYLEEDCDSAVILAAHHKTYGTLPKIVSKHVKHAHCRELPSCNGSRADYQAAHKYLRDIEAA